MIAMRPKGILLTIAFSLLCPAAVPGQARPPEPYIDRDVCPFECCVYREWVARSSIPAYDRAEGHAVVFRLRPGERFAALGGNVHLRRIGVAVASDTVRLDTGDTLRAPVRLTPGDTLYVLSYLGEGAFNVWFRGKRYETFGFWPEPGQESTTTIAVGAVPVAGTLLRAPIFDWWVRVRNANRQTGWILMDEAHVDGEDLCA